MIQVRQIDHIAIATSDMDEGVRRLLSLFKMDVQPREHLAAQKVDAQFVSPPSADTGRCAPTAIEVVASKGNASMDRFVAQRGTALHHICFQVDDLTAALATLKNAQIELIDEKPRPGAKGHLVAFIHPRATGGILIELCQHRPPAGDSQS